MQNFRNVCSFCNSHIAEGQSICKDCMNLYHIKIGNHESDGCGCDKWNVTLDFFIDFKSGSENGITNH